MFLTPSRGWSWNYGQSEDSPMADQNSDDPFAPPDGTVMRPRPGAGRRTGGGTMGAPATGQSASRTYAASQTSYTGTTSVNLTEFLAGARNPIVQAAAPLLTLGARLSA